MTNMLAAPAPAAARLPLKQGLTLAFVTSLVIAALLASASAMGLLYQTTIYPTPELRQSLVANDLVNLFVGLPILLGSMELTRRGRLLGLLFWPGALFYVFYNAMAYILALPLNVSFVLNLIVVAASVYTMVALVSVVDAAAVQGQLQGVVPERLAGGVLVVLGSAFLLFALAMFVTALTTQTPLTPPERATHAADVLIAPALLAGGLLLWRRRPLGYLSAMGLLFQTSMLFIGLIAFLILQPLLTPAPLQLTDLIVTAVMGLICFIPFILFARGAWQTVG